MIAISSLAFDHDETIKQTRLFLKDNLTPSVLKQYMPPMFPLNSLQQIYELLELQDFDNRIFRKRMINQGIVKQTKKREQDVTHLPALLFRFA